MRKILQLVIVSLDCPVGGRRTNHRMTPTLLSRRFLKREDRFVLIKEEKSTDHKASKLGIGICPGRNFS